MTTDRDDEIMRAAQEYEAAILTIKKNAGQGMPGKAAPGQEARQGQAYQRLVRLGAKPQLRLKYRR